jgi:uncharacterized protein YifE (UPF0438 family)
MFGFRNSSRRFIDSQFFPRGFRKSGDFSIAESDILAGLGVTLSGLSNGSLQPESAEEIQFVDVVSGKVEAQTKVEKTWLKYQKLTLTPRKFFTLYSSSKSSASKDDLLEEDTMDYEID